MANDAQSTVDLIAQFIAATEGSASLNRAISDALGVGERNFTSSFTWARALLPASVTNFHLFSFGGHGRDDVKGDCWGCKVHDRAQLIGSERAKHQVKRLHISFRLDEEPIAFFERVIAEQYCEFSATHAATPMLAICAVALKVRIGRTTDDDLWPECAAATPVQVVEYHEGTGIGELLSLEEGHRRLAEYVETSTKFDILPQDVGRYVRRRSTGEVGRIQRDPGNGWLHPDIKYEWRWCRNDFEYVKVVSDAG